MVAASHTLCSAELRQLQRSLDHAALSVLTSVVLHAIWLVKGRRQGYMCVYREEKGNEDCGLRLFSLKRKLFSLTM